MMIYLVIIGRKSVSARERLYERVLATTMAPCKNRKAQDKDMEREDLKSSKLASNLKETLIYSNSTTLLKQDQRLFTRKWREECIAVSFRNEKTTDGMQNWRFAWLAVFSPTPFTGTFAERDHHGFQIARCIPQQTTIPHVASLRTDQMGLKAIYRYFQQK